MPRVARQFQFERSYIFHLLNRGILCQEIFHDAQDFSQFLHLLKRYLQKSPFVIYHWCLMPNHYHLVAEFSKPSAISKVIGACQQVYAYYYHKKYRTAGKLFQNRFKSQAIEKQPYLLGCGRYVELNPVRAKLVEAAWDWQWSSARFYIDARADEITTTDPEWREAPPHEYKKWLLDWQAAEKERPLFASSQSIIGSEHFKQCLIIEAGHVKPKHRGRPRKIRE